MKRKLVISLLVASMVMPTITVNGTVLHTVSNSFEVTRGATLIKEERLTSNGWLDINVLRVDLDDRNIEMRPIGPEVVGQKQNLLDLTKQSGAVASINADFFSLSSSVPSFGPMIAEGEMIQAYNNNIVDVGPNMADGPMATMLMYDEDDVLFDYFTVAFELYKEDESVSEVLSYNKVATYLTKPIILDRRYMNDTSQMVEKFKWSYTIVVEDDEVIAHTEAGEAVDIPRNGYVIMMDSENASSLYSALPIGSEVEVKQSILLNDKFISEIEDVEMGIGGGGLIMKDGKAYEGASNIVGKNSRHPRSIVATTSTPNEVLLIAVDGRGTSIGATHSEVLTLLQSYDVMEAMYLDGGGSTTLVARDQGEEDVTLQNNPSDGSMRGIMNGIGIFTDSRKRNLDKLYIEASTERTFVDEPVTISLKGVDRYDNPVEIDLEDVSYTVVGVEGTVDNHVFYPEEAGEAIIIAEIEGEQVAKELVVTEAPIDLIINQRVVELQPGESKTIEIYGMDEEGYQVPISAEYLVWEDEAFIVSAQGNKITAHATGTKTLEVGYRTSDAKAKVSTIIGDKVLRVQGFETYIPTWGGDTSTVIGQMEATTDVKFEGEQAVKMSYTFNQSENKEVAYAIFDEPIMLPNDTSTFNIWVHGEKQGDTLKIEVVDAEGRTHYLKLAESIDFEGWKYTSAVLTEHIAMPAQVTKLYTYAHSVPEERTSTIYFDHASITRGERNRTGITVEDDYLVDSMYKETLEKPVGDDYVVRVVGPTQNKSLVLGETLLEELSNYLLEDTDKILLASSQNSALALEDKVMTYDNTYQVLDYKAITLITVGTQQGSIRQTNSNQWLQLKETLDTTEADHIIINMSRDPLTSFGDKREGEALHDYLVDYREKTDKDIFVITPGNTEHAVRIEEGIRYMSTPGIIGPTDDIEYGSFIEFKVVDENIYYTFMPMKKK